MRSCPVVRFPPLPTTSRQRFTVATCVHLHAHTSRHQASLVNVPALLAFDEKDYSIAMENAPGRPLHELLISREYFDRAFKIGLRVVAWLRNFHLTPCSDHDLIMESSQPFKAYKADLQYTRLFEYLSPPQVDVAERFLHRQIKNTKSVLHGDLNSRNILVDDENRINVIDFEQGQVGNGIHDVAYLVSEFVIYSFFQNSDPEEQIKRFWREYDWEFRNRLRWEEYRQHLAFQVLYRLKGPSRQVWAGHLDEPTRRQIEDWSLRQFAEWLL
ncbi:aminoglycoside phosphotransferase family protein [Swingsia samuiensis]|uniref:Aminoglycoside phosphotransferase family protein n=1 Tax=Swingsia samuiensis TaxID=1293412 RepID=A0A4Y6UKM3_9PROT|nr:aminoglycoside phosphotransferase family protein [Swingsia samuiensis]